MGPGDGRAKAGCGRGGARRASPGAAAGVRARRTRDAWEEAEEGAPGFLRPESVLKQDSAAAGAPSPSLGCAPRTGVQAAPHLQ